MLICLSSLMMLLRPVHHGGLGLLSVKPKSAAFLIRTLFDLAANSQYIQSQYLNMMRYIDVMFLMLISFAHHYFLTVASHFQHHMPS